MTKPSLFDTQALFGDGSSGVGRGPDPSVAWIVAIEGGARDVVPRAVRWRSRAWQASGASPVFLSGHLTASVSEVSIKASMRQ